MAASIFIDRCDGSLTTLHTTAAAAETPRIPHNCGDSSTAACVWAADYAGTAVLFDPDPLAVPRMILADKKGATLLLQSEKLWDISLAESSLNSVERPDRAHSVAAAMMWAGAARLIGTTGQVTVAEVVRVALDGFDTGALKGFSIGDFSGSDFDIFARSEEDNLVTASQNRSWLTK